MNSLFRIVDDEPKQNGRIVSGAAALSCPSREVFARCADVLKTIQPVPQARMTANRF
jgi:hypothetical protein